MYYFTFYIALYFMNFRGVKITFFFLPADFEFFLTSSQNKLFQILELTKSLQMCYTEVYLGITIIKKKEAGLDLSP